MAFIKFGSRAVKIDLVYLLSSIFKLSKMEVKRRLKSNTKIQIIILKEEK